MAIKTGLITHYQSLFFLPKYPLTADMGAFFTWTPVKNTKISGRSQCCGARLTKPFQMHCLAVVADQRVAESLNHPSLYLIRLPPTNISYLIQSTHISHTSLETLQYSVQLFVAPRCFKPCSAGAVTITRWSSVHMFKLDTGATVDAAIQH